LQLLYTWFNEVLAIFLNGPLDIEINPAHKLGLYALKIVIPNAFPGHIDRFCGLQIGNIGEIELLGLLLPILVLHLRLIPVLLLHQQQLGHPDHFELLVFGHALLPGVHRSQLHQFWRRQLFLLEVLPEIAFI
jgi:hypothetical protein